MELTSQTDQLSPRKSGRRLAPWWGAALALLLVVVSRFVLSDLVIFSDVVQRSCQDGVCVERVHSPDLLFVPGFQEVRVGRDTGAGMEDRYYAQQDPFNDSSDVTIAWNAGGVSIGNGAATLTWDAKTIARLDD